MPICRSQWSRVSERYELLVARVLGAPLRVLINFATRFCYLLGPRALVFGYRADLCVLEVNLVIRMCNCAKL